MGDQRRAWLVTGCVHGLVRAPRSVLVVQGAGQLALLSPTARYFTLHADTLCDLGAALPSPQPVQTMDPEHLIAGHGGVARPGGAAFGSAAGGRIRKHSAGLRCVNWVRLGVTESRQITHRNPPEYLPAFQHLKVVAEPSGAVALAAVENITLGPGSVGVVISGGGVGIDSFHHFMTDSPHWREPAHA
jgi:hypothetical protein